jgi:tRNA1(Val) A37 N6-methylase TrmN6
MLGRLKFDITDLVNEILDQLPSEIWSSSTTTFLDPAIGGGQFVQAVERRLRDAGHSYENIASRVYGYESNRMRINFAVNKYKLVGIYTNADFLEENINMKFDVVVGNPPYQESKEHGKKVTGNGALWVKFTLKSIELCKDNGYVAFIIPDSWTAPTYDLMGSRKSIFNDYFKKYNLI